MERFILHWGEMGPRWGVNRSVAQVHALLYLSPHALPADELAETLSIARSNVSMCLKELQGWGIISIERVLGDRRDHFTSMTDVWEMLRIVLDERKTREIDPTLKVLRECQAEAAKGRSKDDKVVAKRIGSMLSFFETMSSWYHQMRGMSPTAVKSFAKMGAKVVSLFGKKG
jgi:DNA-binding transcriptional regulator GbsR (MarR family)